MRIFILILTLGFVTSAWAAPTHYWPQVNGSYSGGSSPQYKFASPGTLVNIGTNSSNPAWRSGSTLYTSNNINTDTTPLSNGILYVGANMGSGWEPLFWTAPVPWGSDSTVISENRGVVTTNEQGTKLLQADSGIKKNLDGSAYVPPVTENKLTKTLSNNSPFTQPYKVTMKDAQGNVIGTATGVVGAGGKVDLNLTADKAFTADVEWGSWDMMPGDPPVPQWTPSTSHDPSAPTANTAPPSPQITPTVTPESTPVNTPLQSSTIKTPTTTPGSTGAAPTPNTPGTGASNNGDVVNSLEGLKGQIGTGPAGEEPGTLGEGRAAAGSFIGSLSGLITDVGSLAKVPFTPGSAQVLSYSIPMPEGNTLQLDFSEAEAPISWIRTLALVAFAWFALMTAISIIKGAVS
jgi:hypothetical protein